ncbi:hypothetical protein [Methanococcus voltae]|jgi:cell division septal protein FtsQ|uniref:Cell division septal protein FtsQ n=1 Tax=Methanococcus voltae PS TaxID=523842 RepID=A0ABT2EZS4_METVO|nr:hypothetical protein [Methanococcus voltae]MBP2171712.1 cell division septal protein FtsQ [Methanococcus voltae]MCS3922708.1 cell division septal protein FtsQ [Methanococcus voltae PS]
MLKRKKYYGNDPIKKLMNDPEKAEKYYKIAFLLNIWMWFSIFLGSLIFIYWAYTSLS